MRLVKPSRPHPCDDRLRATRGEPLPTRWGVSRAPDGHPAAASGGEQETAAQERQPRAPVHDSVGESPWLRCREEGREGGKCDFRATGGVSQSTARTTLRAVAMHSCCWWVRAKYSHTEIAAFEPMTDKTLHGSRLWRAKKSVSAASRSAIVYYAKLRSGAVVCVHADRYAPRADASHAGVVRF